MEESFCERKREISVDILEQRFGAVTVVSARLGNPLLFPGCRFSLNTVTALCFSRVLHRRQEPMEQSWRGSHCCCTPSPADGVPWSGALILIPACRDSSAVLNSQENQTLPRVECSKSPP